MGDDGWSGLFATAFQRSRNAMLLSDRARVVVDANPALLTLLGRNRSDVVGRPMAALVGGGPLFTEEDWTEALARERFTGEAELVGADGSTIGVQWAASAE